MANRYSSNIIEIADITGKSFCTGRVTFIWLGNMKIMWPVVLAALS